MLNQFLERKIIFHPRKLVKNYTFKIDLDFEELFLETEPGVTLNLLIIKTWSKKPRGVIVYYHGNADNLKRWNQLHTEFTKRGYDFVVYDYRSFGKSTGKPTEENCYADALKVYDFVAERYDAKNMVVYGRSLGTAMASYVAGKKPAKLLVLETPFHNMKGMFKMHAPIIPLPEHLHFRFPIDEQLPNVDYPVVIFQGTKDRIIPIKAAEQLQPLLTKKDKFYIIEGGRHNNLRQFDIYLKGLDKHLGIVRKADMVK